MFTPWGFGVRFPGSLRGAVTQSGNEGQSYILAVVGSNPTCPTRREIKMPKTSYTEAELRDFIKDQLYRFIPDIAHDTQEVKDAVDSVSREIMFAVRYYASSGMRSE